MNITDIYNIVQNPLEQPNFIERILNCYKNTAIYNITTDFYSEIVKTIEKKEEEFNPDDKDKFYVHVFNKWKNNFLSFTDEKIDYLKKTGKIDNNFYILLDYLKKLPPITTAKEVNEVFNNSNLSDELKKVLYHYRWTHDNNDGEFEHICTHWISQFTDPYPDIKHRLYLNIGKADIYKVMNLIFEKCEKEGMPFYFKHSIDCDRDDTIIIYSDENSLEKYLKILREIKTEHPDIFNNSYQPPILTGVIDEWIGYGSEPQEEKNSFNLKRSKLLKESIDTALCKYIENAKNKKINYNGTEISCYDFIFEKTFENYINFMKKLIKQQEKNGHDVKEIYGMCTEDLNNQTFVENLHKEIKPKFIDCLKNIDKELKLPYINITINGNNIKFPVDRYLKMSAIDISNYDSSFSNIVMDEITTNAKKNGIDETKFCFDSYIKNQIQNNPINQHQRITIQAKAIQENPIIKKREDELLQKQGYIGFRKPEAIKAFIQDQNHANWVCIQEDGEYRFFPPKKLDSEKTKEVIDEYRKYICDLKYDYHISIHMLGSNRKNCVYTLSRVARYGENAGKNEIIRKEVFEVEDELLKVLIPTLYSDLSNSLPTETYEKTSTDYSNLYVSNIDKDKFLKFGNLNKQQLDIINEALKFVDKAKKYY